MNFRWEYDGDFGLVSEFWRGLTDNDNDANHGTPWGRMNSGDSVVLQWVHGN